MREHAKKIFIIGGISLAALAILLSVYFGYSFLSGARMLPRLWIGTVPVGGLTRADATEAIGKAIKPLAEKGVSIAVDQTIKNIKPQDISLSYDIAASINKAASYGKLPFKSIPQLIRNGRTVVVLSAQYNPEQLEETIADIADATDLPMQDVHLDFKKGTVAIATETSPGLALNRDQVQQEVLHRIRNANTEIVVAERRKTEPTITLESANVAKQEGESMIKNPIELTYKDRIWTLPSTTLGSWLESKAEDAQLVVSIDEQAIATYVTTIAGDINAKTTAPKLVVENGKVTDFHMPKPSAALEEKTTIDAVLSILNNRRKNPETEKLIHLSVNESTLPELPTNFVDLGITELIGKATTSFAGSPNNRKGNIKNGVKFLTGILVEPNKEFSTIKTLGTIDNTTGYLPELVIKGDRTLPEFGGGLCQVSTTLFRAVMSAGLPITARSPHSYRVSYYEKDGNGKNIGPGLDATIYDPAPDFKFVNDTPGNILVMGFVIGDKATFEIYGTSDGRTSTIDGPHTLTTTPSGDAIYIKTTEVPEGTTKQVEKPHPGGSAIATYTVMRDGAQLYQKVFKSVYRPWPARYLVGVSQATLDAEKKAAETAQPSTDATISPPTPIAQPVVTSPATP